MKSWLRVLVAVAVPFLLASAASLPASAATTPVSTSFIGLTTSESEGCALCGGSPLSSWSFSAITLGPSPTLATLNITYASGVATGAAFTLSDSSGDALTGTAVSATSSTMLVGVVSSGAGAYGGLLGHLVSLQFAVTPLDTKFLSPSSVLGALGPTGGGAGLSPALLIGSITVS